MTALAEVCDQLIDRDIDPEKADEFKSGLADLSCLSDDLNATRDSHEQWQNLDIDLRLIDVREDCSADDLFENWPHVRKVIDPLCGGSRDDWAVQFRAAAERLDRAVTAQDETVADHVRKFRRHVGLRFYKVDTNMKRLCEHLRRTSLPMATTLRVIQ